jgi:transcriptional regulator with XRE-family HTH domain|tara:strand:- start:123 stop:431 length:309 start_codon:yes stop_codon:yes gene_type:complete
MSNELVNQFSKKIAKYRDSRNWSQADLARESGLTQAEISRIESGQRLPTMRIVKGLAEAFSSSTKKSFNEPVRYDAWVAFLVDLGERVRINARTGPGRWAKR